MTDDTQDCFWRAIEDKPEDDLPKLIFADRLDELGDPLADTLRWCVEHGRRPGRFPDGQAFWVTTTTNPVTSQSVRQGRQHVRLPIRPQPSWLAGLYWRFLAAERRAMAFVSSGTVWRYAGAEDAYRDLCRARKELREQLYDPDTGRHRFMGATNSSWRDESRRVIAVTLANLPAGADAKAERKALRAAYPFGERKYHVYKMWCLEVRRAVGSPAQVARRPECLCRWCDGTGCVACAAKRIANERETAHA